MAAADAGAGATSWTATQTLATSAATATATAPRRNDRSTTCRVAGGHVTPGHARPRRSAERHVDILSITAHPRPRL